MSIKVKSWSDLMHQSIKEEGRGPRAKNEVKDEPGGGSSGIYSGESPEYLPNTEDYAEMSKYGLPTEFAMAGSSMGGRVGGGTVIKDEVIRKGEKKQQYYCEVCEIELNSYDTMTSHVKGVKHTKKTMLEEEKRNKAQSEGIYVPEKIVKQIQTVKAAPKKIPVRLSEKLREDTDPIVGLRFIEEVLTCSRAEMEPHYECHLCGNTGGSNGMRAHVFGRPHREKFLQKLHPNEPAYLDISKGELMRLISRLRENDNLDLIKTVYSDELYPWPAGKAPWSIEQGGTGVAPTGTNSAMARRLRKTAILKGVPVENLATEVANQNTEYEGPDVKPRIKGEMPAPEEVEEVTSQKKLQDYYSLALALVEKACEFHAGHCDRSSQGTTVESLRMMLNANLAALKNIDVRQERDQGGPSTSTLLPLDRLRDRNRSGSSSSSRQEREESHDKYGGRRHHHHSSYHPQKPSLQPAGRSPYGDYHSEREREREREAYRNPSSSSSSRVKRERRSPRYSPPPLSPPLRSERHRSRSPRRPRGGGGGGYKREPPMYSPLPRGRFDDYERY